jgi:predicted alpha/beta-fold hydrolase
LKRVDSVCSDLISGRDIHREGSSLQETKISNLMGPHSPPPIGLPAKRAAPPGRDGIDTSAGTVPPFRERAPWFGGDLQTLRNVVRGTPPDLPGGERLLLPMPDGDRLAARLDRPAGRFARPLVVLVHGLAGSEASGNVVASMRHLAGQGWPVLRLNLRGALPSCPTAAGHYHAGRTEDLAEALRGLPADLTRYGIVVLGHSLGGNLVLKFMGEGGHGLPVLAAVAVSTPIDLAATCARMMTRRNFIYHRYMLDAMKSEAVAPGAAVSATERAAISAARNVYEFDDRFIAPRFGYRDAQDYYESNAAKHFLAGIARPTLVLHALDDPWIPAACYTAIDWSRLPMIEAVLTRRGGHLGFHGRGSRVPWHDRVTVWWLARNFRLGPNEMRPSKSSPS